MNSLISTAVHNSSYGQRQATSRPVPVPLPPSNHVNPQTREDGSYLLGTTNCTKPQVRLPPLDGFDEFTIRQLYSSSVADMTRLHPEIVSWIGKSAIEMIESLATREHNLENEIIKEVADLRLKFRVMKAELDETRSKQLQQEALEELNSIKGEMDNTPQSSFTGPNESTFIPSLRTQIPQNTALGSEDPISLNVSQSHPYVLIGTKARLNSISNPALILNSSPGSRSIPPESEICIGGLSASDSRKNEPFRLYSEGRTFLNCGTPEFDFASESRRPLYEPSSLALPPRSLDGKSSQVSSPRQNITLSPAQYNSTYGRDRHSTISTAAFNRQELTSCGTNVVDFGNNRNTDSLQSGPRNHQSFGAVNAFSYTSQHCMPPGEAGNLTVGKGEQPSKRKKPSNVGKERQNSNNAKKAKIA